MVLEELKEALGLLRQIPALWIPGIVTGIFAAGIWMIYNNEGSFFASRFILICSLISVFLITGSYVMIMNGSGNIRELITSSVQYFFRVLLPLLVIIFCTLILVSLVAITFSFGGIPVNQEFVGIFAFFIFVPVVFFTIFFDTAAVFENLRVFDAIRRSIGLVTVQSGRVLGFFVISAAVWFAVMFSLMMVWEAVLYDKLEPLTHFNETQIAAFTPEQLIGMIGADGTIITAVCLFLGCLVLLPILTTYKACFFRSLTKASIPVSQETTGEFDSKGRWYKY
jgi:hypothetical protein